MPLKHAIVDGRKEAKVMGPWVKLAGSLAAFHRPVTDEPNQGDQHPFNDGVVSRDESGCVEFGLLWQGS